MGMQDGLRDVSVVHLTFSGDFGGREKAAGGLCRAMTDEGMTCRLLVVLETRAGEQRNANLLNALQEMNLHVDLFHTGSRFSMSLARRISKKLYTLRANVLHCHCYKSLFYALMLKLTGGFKGVVVYTLHGIELPFGLGATLIRLFQRIGLHFADGIVGCSHEVVDRSLHGRRHPALRVFLNAVETSAGGFEAARAGGREAKASLARRFGIDPSRPLVINIGRLCRQKNFPLFLRLIRNLADKGDRCCFANYLIAGDGALRSELEAEADHLKLRDLLCFAGFVPDMDELYRGADLLVQTSIWEGTPMCLLEARARGLPVVAPAVGGNVDVVRDGQDGALYPVNDLETLAGKVISYLRDPELRKVHGLRAFEHVAQNFDPARWVRLHRDFYEILLSPGLGGGQG